MTSQMKKISLIVLAVVLAAGLSLLGLGLSGVLFKGGGTVQTGTGGTEAAAVAPTEGGETSIFPVVGPEAVTTEDIALISQGEPVAAISESAVADRPMEIYEGDVFFVGPAVTTTESVPSPEALDLIAYGDTLVPEIPLLEFSNIADVAMTIDTAPALTVPDMDIIFDSVAFPGASDLQASPLPLMEPIPDMTADTSSSENPWWPLDYPVGD